MVRLDWESRILTNDNSHTVDGYGLNDLLVLTFASTSRLVSATFGYAGVEPNSYDDFAFFADDSDPGTSLVGDMIFSSEDIIGIRWYWVI